MPIDLRTASYAALLLRLSLGILFLAHAGLKIFVFTPAGTAAFFGSLGLPPALGYVTIVWELVGAVALILGVWPRVAAVTTLDADLKESLHTLFGQWHTWFAYALYACVFLHLAGALKHQWLDREPELQRMWPRPRRDST